MPSSIRNTDDTAGSLDRPTEEIPPTAPERTASERPTTDLGYSPTVW